MASPEDVVTQPEFGLKQGLETLSEDCVFEILDRLPTNHLYTVADTCLRFYDLASIQYRRKYPDKFVCVSVIEDKIVLLPDEYDVKKFGHKFLNMIIRGENRNERWPVELLEYILTNCSASLQMIRFESAMLHGDYLNMMKHMFKRVELIVLHQCGINDDLYDYLLAECYNLKQLILSDSYTTIDSSTGNKWMQQKYPQLKKVQICSMTILPFQRTQWEQFFRQNPQIQEFSCDHWYSVDCMDRPVNVIAKNAPNLKRLYISLRGIGHLNGTYYDLRQFCQIKHLQELELQFTGNTGIHYLTRHSKMLTMMDRLYTLHLTDMTLMKDNASIITALKQLKRLNFVTTTFTNEFAECISKELPNLEEIYCNTVNDFTVFIKTAPKLKKIELANTEFTGLNLGWGLHWLNEERRKICNAVPITIYVKRISMEDTEHTIIASGIIAIRPLLSNKNILTNVKHTFVH